MNNFSVLRETHPLKSLDLVQFQEFVSSSVKAKQRCTTLTPCGHLKRNSLVQPRLYLHSPLLSLQLRYNGLLETIRIRRDGFSWRPTFTEFVERCV